MQASPASLRRNLSMAEFSKTYRCPGKVLSEGLSGDASRAKSSPQFQDRQRTWKREVVERKIETMKPQSDGQMQSMQHDLQQPLLCCPRDQACVHNCSNSSQLWYVCRIPMCTSCRLNIMDGQTVPTGLANDKWYNFFET